MIKRWIAPVLSAVWLLPASALAAEFRGLQFGASCATVQESELARGSTQIEWEAVRGSAVYAFLGRGLDRDLMFNYLCEDGYLSLGNYYLPVETLDAAIASYVSAQSHLIDVHGAPVAGPSTRANPEDPRGYMTMWSTDGLGIIMALMPSFAHEQQGWRVFVSYRHVPRRALTE